WFETHFAPPHASLTTEEGHQEYPIRGRSNRSVISENLAEHLLFIRRAENLRSSECAQSPRDLAIALFGSMLIAKCRTGGRVTKSTHEFGQRCSRLGCEY